MIHRSSIGAPESAWRPPDLVLDVLSRPPSPHHGQLFDNLADPDALFVVGKSQKNLHSSHAWVYWRNENRWWILDCTNRSQPIAADSVSDDRYVPYYSYGRSGAYRHKATRLLIDPASPNSGAPAVADHAAMQREN